MPEENLRNTFAQNLRHYLEESGRNQTELSKYMNVSSATASDWCNGRKMPRADKIQSIANWLGVSIGNLMEDRNSSQEYYINDEAREMAEFLFKNPEYKVLFDASRKVKKEDIEFVKEMIDRVRGDSDDTGC